jgi:PDDEXK-like domain of unknown function (DUF3799)
MGILERAHGLHLQVPEDEYHQRILGVASKGALDKVRRSPAHYKAWVDGTAPEETSAALEFGKMLHCAILEPDVFETTYVVAPDFGDQRFKENKAKKAAWLVENDGRMPVDAKDFRAFLGMADSIRRHPKAGPLLVGGDAEVTVRWRDEETGIECKARLDYHLLQDRIVLDLKSTDDARERAFSWSAADYGYDRQAAFYSDALAALGLPVDDFYFVAAEKRAPHLVGFYNLSDEDLRKGRATIREDLRALADCLERDEWGPGVGYSTNCVTLSLPRRAA